MACRIRKWHDNDTYFHRQLEHDDSNLITLLYSLSIIQPSKVIKLKCWLLFKTKKKFLDDTILRPGWIFCVIANAYCSQIWGSENRASMNWKWKSTNLSSGVICSIMETSKTCSGASTRPVRWWGHDPSISLKAKRAVPFSQFFKAGCLGLGSPITRREKLVSGVVSCCTSSWPSEA